MTTQNEFSRTIKVSNLKDPKQFSYEATNDECTALAERLGIVAIRSFAISGIVCQSPNGLVQLKAQLTAQITQECISTFSHFESVATDEFEELYKRGPLKEHEEESEDPEWPEWDDVIMDNIDVGEIAVQYLSLALNPYPRSPDLDPYQYIEDDSDSRVVSIKKKIEEAS
jgi:hypothetical protein